jgi:predicted transcriptional regulator
MSDASFEGRLRLPNRKRHCHLALWRGPSAIQAESSLAQVAATLAEYDVSGLPVVDRGGAVIGVLTQTDAERDADHCPGNPLPCHDAP